MTSYGYRKGDSAPTSLPETIRSAGVRETVESILVAVMLALLFKAFEAEAFVIPTGSMAPTLQGSHKDVACRQCDYRYRVSASVENPDSSRPGRVVETCCPFCRFAQPVDPTTDANHGTFSGDRILVSKFSYDIAQPRRWDVAVFRFPENAKQPFIKRLVGLPGEQVALIDGDIFARTVQTGDENVTNPWALPGWKAARKPERAQLAMWQEVFDSRFTPLSAMRDGSRWFTSPWVAGSQEGEWQIEDRRDYGYSGGAPTTLRWNDAFPILDSYAYNEPPPRQGGGPNGQYPVSDLRISMGVRPRGEGLTVSAVVEARRHEFRARVIPGGGDQSTAILEMRPTPVQAGADAAQAPWTELSSVNFKGGFAAGRATNIELWHADQSLRLYVDDRLVASAEYDWTPDERLRYALGMTLDEVAANDAALIFEQHYSRPGVRVEFSGGPFTLYRVALARDIHYRADTYHDYNDYVIAGERMLHSRRGQPAHGTHPKSTVILNQDQFFVCGDNSPQSLDARLWDVPNPWVAEMDRTTGVVNRDLLIGKAFFVYFPAPYRNHGVPVPDFGSMRFIW